MHICHRTLLALVRLPKETIWIRKGLREFFGNVGRKDQNDMEMAPRDREKKGLERQGTCE